MRHIRMLKALHGDAFILYIVEKENNNGIVVVDGGPVQDSFKIVNRLEELGTIDHGLKYIMMMTILEVY